MKYCLLLALIITTCLCQDSLIGLSLEERCERLGYQYEEHTVTTEDGYILTIHRVPGLTGEDISNKPPILMSKFILASYTAIFSGNSDSSPGFYLAQNGFDVWSISTRGGEWSNQHLQYTTNDKEFWNYTATDYRYDFMAAVDYIIETTEFSQVYLYGQCLGGQIIAYALALEPEFFGQRVRLFHSPGSAVNLAHTQNLAIMEAALNPTIFDVLNTIGNGHIRISNPFQGLIQEIICTQFEPLCALSQIFIMNDVQIDNRNMDTLLDLLSPSADDVSVNAVHHIFQSIRTGEVTEFDYGPVRNMEEYGQRTPPRIPIENIEVPVMLYQGEFDETCVLMDALWFAERLDQELYLGIILYDMDHFAFGVGDNIHEFLDDIIEVSNENPIVR